MTISAIILTKNSEGNIKNCIKSIFWCDEIIVIDDNSIDQTVRIAKENNAKVYLHDLHNNFSAQRNFGIEKATSDWILFIDSDEIVSEKLVKEITAKINSADTSGIFIKRVDCMWGKELKHGEVGNIWLLRLARKNKGKWVGNVHETWQITGKTERLDNILMHYPHPTMSEFLQKINYYSSLRAEELFQQKISVSWVDIIAYPKSKFWLNYLWRLGFLDGIPGFLIAATMSFHSFLVRGKLWQLQNYNS